MTEAIEGQQIAYRRGYYYQLIETYSMLLHELRGAAEGLTLLRDGERIIAQLDSLGNLTAYAGYCWDGASGPAWDTHTVMRASLIHDLPYQFCRYGLIAPEWRPAIDRAFRRVCLEDGMYEWRANYLHRGVRLGGGPSVDPANRRKLFISPPRVLILAA